MPEWCEMPLLQHQGWEFHTVRNACLSGRLKTKKNSPQKGKTKIKKVRFKTFGFRGIPQERCEIRVFDSRIEQRNNVMAGMPSLDSLNASRVE